MGKLSVGKVGRGKEVHIVWDYTVQVKKTVDTYVDTTRTRACCGTGDIHYGERRNSTITKIDATTEITCSKCLAILADAERSDLAEQLKAAKEDQMVKNVFKVISIIARKELHGF